MMCGVSRLPFIVFRAVAISTFLHLVAGLSPAQLPAADRPARVPLPDGRVSVSFLLTEFVQEVVYKGAKAIQPEVLAKLTGVRKGLPQRPADNRAACLAIIDEYHRRGHALATCVLSEGHELTDTRVVFKITEGPVVCVYDIDFRGNEFASSGVLQAHLKSSGKVTASVHFDPQAIAEVMETLTNYYRSFDFRDVKVSRELVYDPDATSVSVIYHIDEGSRHGLDLGTWRQRNEIMEQSPPRVGQLFLPGNYSDQERPSQTTVPKE